ncbi:MAG: hypothetical protein GY746_18640, partial [Gammaproteobacteria bacterium]|nr:hypothetical protein [Gammaproteobacteria bacterium]
GGGGGANGNNGNTWFRGAGVMCSSCTGNAAWALDPDYIANTLTNSSGGGRGGYSFSTRNQNALTMAPGQAAWFGDLRAAVGGLGGRPLDANEQNKIFFGGGGGAGDGNNGANNDGADGGGIVYIVANSVLGSGSLSVNGATALNTIPGHNDAPGGGGGGGSLVIRSASLSNSLTLSAIGGNGGNQLIVNDEAEGPGGGGGGGFVATSTGSPTITILGGSNGTTSSTALTEFPANGATIGATGKIISAISTSAFFCNMPPIAIDDAETTAEDTPVSVDVLDLGTADSDVESNILITSVGSTSGSNDGTTSEGGTVTINNNTTPSDSTDDFVDYTPFADYFGTDTFYYIITDAEGLTDTAEVVITVTPVNDPPIAIDDAETTAEDTPVSVDVLDLGTADSDVESNILIT